MTTQDNQIKGLSKLAMIELELDVLTESIVAIGSENMDFKTKAFIAKRIMVLKKRAALLQETTHEII